MRCHCARDHQRSQNGKTVRAIGCSSGRNECRAREAVVERKSRHVGTDRGGRPRRCGAKSSQRGKAQMTLRSTTLFLAFAAALCAEELPRKSKTPRESYPNVDVIYDSVTSPDGKRLRTIITKPHDSTRKLPVIFVAGWLSCDSIEAPPDTKDATGLVFRGLAQLPGFCLFRIDKQGVGDSEGVCAENDFASELAGLRAAFRALKNY